MAVGFGLPAVLSHLLSRRQPTDMQIEQQGPDHAVVFRASLNFQAGKDRAANEVLGVAVLLS